MAAAAMADNCTKKEEMSDNILAVLASPVTVPANILAIPYWGVVESLKGSDKVQSRAGRIAIQVAIVPFAIPAAILNIPSAILSPTGLTGGF